MQTATTKDAIRLFHEGALALSAIEANGMRIDVKYLDNQIETIGETIQDLSVELKADPIFRSWRRAFGRKTKLGSRDQLAHLLFKVMKYPCTEWTPTGRPKADDHVMGAIDLPFVEKYLKLEKLKKAKNTYLEGIRREVVDGYLHPNFPLNFTRTFRSSSDSPNFQNMPVRDKDIAKLIRSCFIPRKGHQIGEVDESGAEVRMAACYHKDPMMIRYIKDTTTDLHRDMAMEGYFLKQEEVSKDIRYVAKNQFVFPQFYGSYYVDCASAMWESIDKMKLTTVSGVGLKEHLKNKGIRKLGACDQNTKPIPGTFEHHIKNVEDKFWKMFKVYASWKRSWWEKYNETGEFTMLTGFRVQGIYRRNMVMNYPVQGSCFHTLLWGLIRLQKWMVKHRMRSKLIGQIHDSIVGDFHENELMDCFYKAQEILTVDLPKAWPFIIVPWAVECEASPLGESWFKKEKVTV